MKKVLYAVMILVVAGLLFFQRDLRELYALYQYSSTFEPDSIDENFRSIAKRFDTVTIKRAGDIYELPVAAEKAVLPETFEYLDSTVNVQEWLTRVQTTGMAIMKDGELVYEFYDRGNSEESHAILMSVSKSVASMLVGVAVDEGLIESIDDPVVKYAPALKGTAYDDGVRVKDVLQMSSGVRWNEDYGDLNSDLVRSLVASQLGSLDEFTASVPRENAPGSYNRYASIDTHALGMIIRGATGKPYEVYLQEKLWSKLGAQSDIEMMVDAAGQPVVYGGINMVLRDMLRFGQLYLDQGKNYAGEQLVSADWVLASTRPDGSHTEPGIDNPKSDTGFGYGYQWWLPIDYEGDYSAIGIYGQFIYVNPQYNVVIAKTSAYANYTVDGGWMNYETLVAFQAIAKALDK